MSKTRVNNILICRLSQWKGSNASQQMARSLKQQNTSITDYILSYATRNFSVSPSRNIDLLFYPPRRISTFFFVSATVEKRAKITRAQATLSPKPETGKSQQRHTQQTV